MHTKYFEQREIDLLKATLLTKAQQRRADPEHTTALSWSCSVREEPALRCFSRVKLTSGVENTIIDL